MSIYGYSNRQVNDYGLQELSEVSLELPPADLRAVARFLNHCAELIESGQWRTSHRHLTTHEPDWNKRHRNSDVIVLHPSPDPPKVVSDES